MTDGARWWGLGEAGICAALLPVNLTHFKVLWLVTSYLNKVVGSILASCILCTWGLEESRDASTGGARTEALAFWPPLSTEVWDWGGEGVGKSQSASWSMMRGFGGLFIEIPEPSDEVP